MKRHFFVTSLALLLLAVPLSAQQTVPISVPDQTLRIETPPAEVDVDVSVQLQVDSATARAFADAYAEAAQPALDALAAQLAQSQQQQGPGTAERTIRNVAWIVLGIIAVKKLHDISKRPPNVTNVEVINQGDAVTVNVPPVEHHDHKHEHHDD